MMFYHLFSLFQIPYQNIITTFCNLVLGFFIFSLRRALIFIMTLQVLKCLPKTHILPTSCNITSCKKTSEATTGVAGNTSHKYFDIWC